MSVLLGALSISLSFDTSLIQNRYPNLKANVVLDQKSNYVSCSNFEISVTSAFFFSFPDVFMRHLA